MMIDIHFERGFAEVDHKFGDAQLCHFPLFNFLKPLPFQWMCQVYLVMWLGKLPYLFHLMMKFLWLLVICCGHISN
jgi:vitamin K-dependent gamma-carboxylase